MSNLVTEQVEHAEQQCESEEEAGEACVRPRAASGRRGTHVVKDHHSVNSCLGGDGGGCGESPPAARQAGTGVTCPSARVTGSRSVVRI